ncbi:unnamed protein product [Citrullus colocynthis]|uniref:Uncharacterized protein n=1 Tax=Citrullus colocynthis TaxID=252529 RepID=A0ABP0YBS4_9ROSI
MIGLPLDINRRRSLSISPSIRQRSQPISSLSSRPPFALAPSSLSLIRHFGLSLLSSPALLSLVPLFALRPCLSSLSSLPLFTLLGFVPFKPQIRGFFGRGLPNLSYLEQDLSKFCLSVN